MPCEVCAAGCGRHLCCACGTHCSLDQVCGFVPTPGAMSFVMAHHHLRRGRPLVPWVLRATGDQRASRVLAAALTVSVRLLEAGVRHPCAVPTWVTLLPRGPQFVGIALGLRVLAASLMCPPCHAGAVVRAFQVRAGAGASR